MTLIFVYKIVQLLLSAMTDRCGYAHNFRVTYNNRSCVGGRGQALARPRCYRVVLLHVNSPR